MFSLSRFIVGVVLSGLMLTGVQAEDQKSNSPQSGNRRFRVFLNGFFQQAQRFTIS